MARLTPTESQRNPFGTPAETQIQTATEAPWHTMSHNAHATQNFHAGKHAGKIEPRTPRQRATIPILAGANSVAAALACPGSAAAPSTAG